MAKIMIQIEADDQHHTHKDLVRFVKELQLDFCGDTVEMHSSIFANGWTVSVVEEDGLVTVREAKFN